MTFEFLDMVSNGPIFTVSLARPPVNAITQRMYAELESCFGDIRSVAGDAKVVILTGQGKHFCGGNDLTEFESLTPENGPGRMLQVRQAFWAIRRCRLPVIAAVNGAALGTGLAIAASCDLIVASTEARFGLPEVGVGVMGGARHLARLVPPNVVRKMFYTSDPVPAEALAAYGGIAATVSPEDLQSAAEDLALHVCRHSRLAIEVAKISLNRIESLTLEGGYRLEQGLTSWMSQYEDAKEALTAVKQRRLPQYNDDLPADDLSALLLGKDLV